MKDTLLGIAVLIGVAVICFAVWYLPICLMYWLLSMAFPFEFSWIGAAGIAVAVSILRSIMKGSKNG